MSADIDAATLVRDFRRAEAWIESAQSFRLRAEGHVVRTPEGLAASRGQYKEQFPDLEPTPEQFPDLRPEVRDSIELAFDQRRIYRRHDDPTYLYDRRIWDGHRGVHHEYYPHSGQEHYAISTDAFRAAGQLVLADLAWPRAAYHPFWWLPKDEGAFWIDRFGRPEDFDLVGRECCRGVDCYALELGDHTRWYVGAADHRLYGTVHRVQVPETPAIREYVEGVCRELGLSKEALAAVPPDERRARMREAERRVRHLTIPSTKFWFADYAEVGPGCWLPMTQETTHWDLGGETPIPASTKYLRVADVQVDRPLPADLFEVSFKEGVDVYEWDHNPPLIYKHRDHWTPEAWQAVLDEANERRRRENERTHAQDALIGRPAPEFAEVAWINTPPLTLSALAGKPVVLAFWSTACGPCRNDFPVLRDLHARGPAAGLHVIALHGPGPTAEDVSAAAKKFDLTYPICLDVTGETYKAYRNWRLPSAVLLDGRGHIAAHGTLHEMLAAARGIATDGNAAG